MRTLETWNPQVKLLFNIFLFLNDYLSTLQISTLPWKAIFFFFRRISTINKYLQEKGYDIDKLWADIDDVIIKTVISAHSVLRHNYRSCFPNHLKGSACFEILGIDILLDRKLKPSILEVVFLMSLL